MKLALRPTVDIVDVKIEQADGAFLATSPQLPEILLFHDDLEAIFEDLPHVIAAVYLSRFQREVSVLLGSRSNPGARPDVGTLSWVVVDGQLPVTISA